MLTGELEQPLFPYYLKAVVLINKKIIIRVCNVRWRRAKKSERCGGGKWRKERQEMEDQQGRKRKGMCLVEDGPACTITTTNDLVLTV